MTQYYVIKNDFCGEYYTGVDNDGECEFSFDRSAACPFADRDFAWAAKIGLAAVGYTGLTVVKVTRR